MTNLNEIMNDIHLQAPRVVECDEMLTSPSLMECCGEKFPMPGMYDPSRSTKERLRQGVGMIVQALIDETMEGAADDGRMVKTMLPGDTYQTGLSLFDKLERQVRVDVNVDKLMATLPILKQILLSHKL